MSAVSTRAKGKMAWRFSTKCGK